MFRYTIFIALIFILNGCNLTHNLNIDKDFELTMNKKLMTYDSCTRLSYILQNNDFNFGELFVEYINLDNSCRWNGLQRGYFVDLFKSTIKINSLRLIERKEYKNYEFSTYIIDEKYYLNIVCGYTVYEDLFIIDYDGKYTTKFLLEFDKNYENIYSNKPRFSSNYSNSLVKMNFINRYFSKERENHFEK